MITWRADNPEAPPPMIQISMVSLSDIPSSTPMWSLYVIVHIWDDPGSSVSSRQEVTAGDKSNRPAVPSAGLYGGAEENVNPQSGWTPAG